MVDLCFRPSRKKLPLIVVMHGYSGGRDPVRPDILRLAEKGLFAIAPDMRGRGKSGGVWDSGGLDVMDIYDAVQFCCKKFPRQVDATNLNVMGYSGGGANAFSCFVRFPDTFRVAAAFFGITDYAAWYRSKGRIDCNKILIETLGGKPSQLPAVYAARNVTPGAGNNGQTRFHIFWDEAETECPGWMNEEFVKANRAAGFRNCIPHCSRKRDKARWHHGYTTNRPELIQAEQYFVPDILRGRIREPKLPREGTLIVPGYVVTKHFQIFVQPRGKPEMFGRSGLAEVAYRLGPSHHDFVIRSVTKGHEVRIVQATR